MDYIEMHPYDKISISELAASVGYTDYYLSHKFKKEAGCSPHDYILQQKMACARNLLTVTDLSVQEVSERLHFYRYGILQSQNRHPFVGYGIKHGSAQSLAVLPGMDLARQGMVRRRWGRLEAPRHCCSE